MSKLRVDRVVATGCVLAVMSTVGIGAIRGVMNTASHGSITEPSYNIIRPLAFAAANGVISGPSPDPRSEGESKILKCCKELTADEIYTLATLVYLESSIESVECQRDIASTVINRMVIENKSLDDIVYASGQFTPACRIPYEKPSDESLEAVKYIVKNGTTLPVYVTYFRSGYYHEWGDLIGYREYENTYFSYSIAIKELCEELGLISHDEE